MKAVILAAGQGTRMKDSTPKCLLQIGAQTLLDRHLSILKSLGLEKTWVVIGNGGIWNGKWQDAIREIVQKTGGEVLINSTSLETHSAASLVLGLQSCSEDILAIDGDLFYTENIIQRLAERSETTIVVTRQPGTAGSRVIMRSMSAPGPTLPYLQDIAPGRVSPHVYCGMMKIAKHDLPMIVELCSNPWIRVSIMAELIHAMARQIGVRCLIAARNEIINVNTWEDRDIALRFAQT